MSERTKDVPELRFRGFEGKWERRRFDEIVERASTSCCEPELPRVEYEDVVPGTGDLNKDIFSKESDKKGIEFHPGDVLYGKLRPYLHHWLLPDFSGIAVGDFWVMRPITSDARFVYRLIQGARFDEVANQSAGSKMPRADWKLISNMEFQIPSSIDEQAKIAGVFDNLDNLITLHQRKLNNYFTISLYLKHIYRR